MALCLGVGLFIGAEKFGATAEQTPTSAPSPAIARASEQQRVLVTRVLGEEKLYFKPHSFRFAPDGSFGIGLVQWRKYGGAVASATGRGFAYTCDPTCKAGRVFYPKAQLWLSRVIPCHGRAVYSRLRFEFTGALPKGYLHEGSFSMLPLDEEDNLIC